MTDKLEPCPFCGGKAVFSSKYEGNENGGGHLCFVECTVCGARTSDCLGFPQHCEENRISAWNTRPADKPQDKEKLITCERGHTFWKSNFLNGGCPICGSPPRNKPQYTSAVELAEKLRMNRSWVAGGSKHQPSEVDLIRAHDAALARETVKKIAAFFQNRFAIQTKRIAGYSGQSSYSYNRDDVTAQEILNLIEKEK